MFKSSEKQFVDVFIWGKNLLPHSRFSRISPVPACRGDALFVSYLWFCFCIIIIARTVVKFRKVPRMMGCWLGFRLPLSTQTRCHWNGQQFHRCFFVFARSEGKQGWRLWFLRLNEVARWWIEIRNRRQWNYLNEPKLKLGLPAFHLFEWRNFPVNAIET